SGKVVVGNEPVVVEAGVMELMRCYSLVIRHVVVAKAVEQVGVGVHDLGIDNLIVGQAMTVHLQVVHNLFGQGRRIVPAVSIVHSLAALVLNDGVVNVEKSARRHRVRVHTGRGRRIAAAGQAGELDAVVVHREPIVPGVLVDFELGDVGQGGRASGATNPF